MIDYGTIKTKSEDPLDERLGIINKRLQTLQVLHRPTYVLLEELNLQFQRRNFRDLMLYSSAWGAIQTYWWMVALASRKLREIYHVPLPIPDKRISAGARKEMIIMDVKQRHILGPESGRLDEHNAEAIYWAMEFNPEIPGWTRKTLRPKKRRREKR